MVVQSKDYGMHCALQTLRHLANCSCVSFMYVRGSQCLPNDLGMCLECIVARCAVHSSGHHFVDGASVQAGCLTSILTCHITQAALSRAFTANSDSCKRLLSDSMPALQLLLDHVHAVVAVK